MDGDPVTEEPSEDKEQDHSPVNYTEMFMKVFPSYMAMGMTYDEFWHGPAWLAQSYRKATEEKRRQEEWARWRQGAYIYHALLDVAPVMRASFSKQKVEPGKYPEEPWPITEQEAQLRREKQEREMFQQGLAQLRQRSKKALAEKEANVDGGDRES